MNLKNTRTEKNLIKALQGEALAYMKYIIYASLIGKESKIYEKLINEIAHNEKEHWKVYAKLLLEDEYYNNNRNLADAIMGEHNECTTLYPEFARIAREEGFNEIAEKFEAISEIECRHEKEFDIILKELQTEKNNIFWKCSNCGYIHKGQNIPNECPVCNHPQNYFL